MPDSLFPCPKWDRDNLEIHHYKRTTVDAGCFEDLLTITGRIITDVEYRQRSLATIADAWAVYSANETDDHPDAQTGARHGLRKYHVDSEFVISITCVDGHKFITCFHKGNFLKKTCKPEYHRKGKGEIGDRQIEFRRRICNDVRGEKLIDFNHDKGFPDDFPRNRTMALSYRPIK